MRLGLLVPAGHLEKDIPILKEKFNYILIDILVYSSVSQIPKILSEKQRYLDYLLFLGKTTVEYTATKITPIIPWEVIPRTSSTLFMSLLKAQLAGNTITNLITDLHPNERSILNNAYKELGIKFSTVSIHYAPPFTFDETFIKQMKNFYFHYHQQYPTATCLTIYSDIARALSFLSFPIQYYCSGLSDICNSIEKAHTNFLLQVSRESQLVIIHIIVDEASEYSPLLTDEYQATLELLTVAKYIYIFTKKIQGAVSQISDKEFLIFSTRAILKNQTDQFYNFSLIDDIHTHTASTISIGIGFGKTAQEAKYHAKTGVKKAQKSKESKIFLIYDQDTIRSITTNKKTTSPDIPDQFLSISTKTGISAFTLGQIHQLINEQGKAEFTPTELASYLQVSLRSVNRTILKLLDTGYCFEIGRKFQPKGGRPSRILRFKL